MSACISEPVSWPRLERYGLGEVSPADALEIARHLAACPVCGECFARIASDRAGALDAAAPQVAPVAQPSQRLQPAHARSRRRPSAAALGIAGTLLSAALGTWLTVRPLTTTVTVPADPRETAATTHPTPLTRLTKGGSFAVELVRMDARGRLLDASKFGPGDRFKLMFSCPPAMAGTIGELRVWVFQGGEVFEPLPVLESAACGNRRAVPGALQLTGTQPAEICAVMRVEAHDTSVTGPAASRPEPPQTPSQLPDSRVCVRVAPE